ncbi:MULTISPECIES: DUF3102 domain-containing protein [Levilactobacillus]|uniref:DUF3102 domain-containing protein n=1 Tax=Levilactobacillus TaxID=2767886 RepID=UPI0025A504EE|nr:MULTISPECIES: DUF3102 domain-containing protein [Levilactobacillus]MDM5047514.1 DUF3102 domain-containing protein [Levilactobacillus brevis]MDM5047575.1 DUF3102 domain-containing protein [Levilactobacillus brevis]MDM5047813.1 DUF3102 domain-containing protein [Levilactobacillus brevis]MDT6981603.1 DUF3102 domain-containing protein [Levilactobacillus zymae]
MENAGRRDITSQAEETSAVELSHNLTTVTTEIKAYQSIGGQAIFEIGRRLKWVKENDLVHGEFGKWLESIDIKPRQAQRFIKIANEFSNTTTSSYLGMNVLYEIATMPPEERDNPQQLDSGETKKPDEMTVRELRETKRKLAAAYSENMANQTLLTQADKKAKKLQAQVTKLQQRDPDIKQVEVEPADYQDTKADLKAANEKIADLQKLVDDAVDDHNQRLAYELELEKAKADQEEIKADLNDLEVKRQNMLKQNAQIREVQKMVKSINELLDNFAVLRNRLDTTMLPDESSLVQGLTEMADKLIENGQVLHDDLAHPYRG